MSRNRALAQLRASTDPWDPAALAAALTAMFPAHQNERTPPEVALEVGWLHYQRQEYELTQLCFTGARDYLSSDARAWLDQQPEHDCGDGRLWLSYPRWFTQLSNDPRVLEPAIALAQAVVATTGEAVDLSHLAAVQREMYLATGNETFLTEATRAAEEAVGTARNDDPDRGTYLRALAAVHHDRAERTGDVTAFDAAVATMRAAVQHTPSNHPNSTTRTADLGTMLLSRFRASGSRQDLEESIQVLISTTRPDAPDRGWHLSVLSSALRQRFLRTAADQDLQASEAAGRTAVELIPKGHFDRSAALGDLGLTLLLKFGRTDRLDVLTEAVDILRAAVASARNPLQVTHRLGNLGLALADRAERTGSDSDLDEAIEVMRAVRARTPAGHPHTVVVVSNLGRALLRLHERTSDHTFLVESIELLRLALASAPDDHPERFTLLTNLGSALWNRFKHIGDLTDLDEAVLLQRKAVESAPQDHPRRPMIQSNLARALTAGYHRGGAPELLDAAIELNRSAVTAVPGDHPSRTMFLSDLADDLRIRFRRFGRIADLNESVGLCEAVLAEASAGHPNRIRLKSNLAQTLLVRFERLGEVPDLDRAVELLRTAVESTPRDHVQYAARVEGLADVMRARYEPLNRIEDLDEAVRTMVASVDSAPAGHHQRALHLANLSASQRARYTRNGDIADLHASIESARQAVQATPEDHPDIALRLGMLSLALVMRYDHAGDLGDLDEATNISRLMMSQIPAGHPYRGQGLADLARVLGARFEQFARLPDLSEAIDVCRLAVSSTPPDEPAVYGYRQNLAGYLRMRYDRVGDLNDLDDAIADLRALAESMPGDVPAREMVLANLARDLVARSQRTGDTVELEEALRIARDVVARTPADHTERATRLTVLARALMLRVEAAPDIEVLDEAIDVSRAVLATTPAGHRLHAMGLANLSWGLQARFIRTRSFEDIDEAARIGGLAVASSADSAPDRARTLHIAAAARDLLFTVTQRGDDLNEAIGLCQSAVRETSSPVGFRLKAAIRWGTLADRAGRHDTAVVGFAEALDLLPRAAWLGASRTTREHALREWQGLASASAAAALSAGEPERAVALLEQGRSVLWAQALGLRGDFAALATVDQELADRLRTLADELEGGEGDRERRIRLADEWDTLLTRARALPGMADLLRTPTFEKLCQGLGEHPVVIVNLYSTRCDALIVAHGQVTVVELPNVFDAAHARADAYLTARATLDHPGTTPLDRMAANQTMLATLEWLWDNLAEPVLAELAPPRGGELPRIIWCPTGPMTVLPLHAAGYHDELDGRTVLDRAVTSYVPTLQALAKARQPFHKANERALVVAVPTTEGLPPLPGARQEADLIAACFTTRHTSRVGEQAIRNDVLNDLRSHAYVHFACHGGLRVDEPSSGALYLHDGPLTVLDVTALRLTGAEFAFLSACHTAVGGLDLLDESIHIASALQLIGYRHVIATLWTIADLQAPYIARRIYDLLSDGDHLDLTRTARALHQVARELRDTHPSDPSRWASYIHTGP